MQALESHNFLPFLRERSVNLIFSHQGPTVPGIIARQVYFHWSILFFLATQGPFHALQPHRSISHTALSFSFLFFRHTGLFPTLFFLSHKVYFTNCRHIGLFHLFFSPEKVKVLHTSLVTQGYFVTLYLPHGTIVCMLLPHRSIFYSKVACKRTQQLPTMLEVLACVLAVVCKTTPNNFGTCSASWEEYNP